MSKTLSIAWTKNLPDDKKADFELVLRNSTLVLGRLKAILQDELRSTYDAETMKDFEDPNWSHKQAFRNGDRARLRKVLNLLEFLP